MIRQVRLGVSLAFVAALAVLSGGAIRAAATLAVPAISTQASDGTLAGGTVSATALLTGGSSPAGMISFRLYGPGDPTCASPPAATTTAAANGDGQYSSGAVAPPGTGSYVWVASYGGDANNAATADGCSGGLAVQVPESTIPMGSMSGSSTNATVTCPGGTVLTSGGIHQFDAVTTGGETNGLKVNGTMPSDASGNPAADGSTNVASWTAVGGFGGVGESGDEITGFGMCATGGGLQPGSGVSTVVAVSSVTGQGTSSSTSEVHVTALCPSGSIAVGGGALGTPAAIGNFKPVASFPSTAAGVATLDGATDPAAWTVVGAVMGSLNAFGVTTTAFAVCSYDRDLTTVVHVTTLLNQAPPVTGGGSGSSCCELPPIVASCTPGTALLGGGVQYLANGGYPAQGDGYYGFHLTGDYPSDAAGAPVAPGSSAPAAWAAVVHEGGIIISSIDEYAYALCGRSTAAVDVAPAAPTLSSHASPIVALGGSVSDTATLSGGFGPTGAIAFSLYGPGDSSCSGLPVFTSNGTLAAATSSSAAFTPTTLGTYRWVARYGGDANNAAAGGACGDANESVSVVGGAPTLSTVAASGAVGAPIDDAATIAGGTDVGGTIQFELHGPSDPTCAGTAVASSSVPVSGDGEYHSAGFIPTALGTYRWVASYSGDAANGSVVGHCGDANESAQVGKTSPTLTSQASAAVPVGGSLSDRATLTGGFEATGTVDFSLYGPADPTCTGAPVFTTSGALDSGAARAGSFTSNRAGTYRWVASYDGDELNNGSTGHCGDAGESTAVSAAVPALSTTASSGSLGSSITDTATISGGFAPTGTIEFSLYGPGDPTCTGTRLATASATVSGNGSYVSASFMPTVAGTYHWTAAYEGDANNQAATGACGALGESVTVAATTPSLTTQASTASLGSAATDTATILGGASPTGTVSFALYGPDDPDCTGTPVATSTAAVAGNGSYASQGFSPTIAGTYRWIARYSGDANNSSAAGACSDPSESLTIAAAVPTLSSQASAAAQVGQPVADTATLSGGFSPTGTVAFALYGPDDSTCTTPVSTSSGVLTGGTAMSDTFAPSLPGTYRWVASYGGDVANAAVAGSCGDAHEAVVVSSARPTLSSQVSSASAVVGSAVTDTATLAGGFQASGTIAFALYGPADPTCAGTPIFTTSVAVSGSAATSHPFTPAAVGSYRFVATYSGDAANAPAAGACGDAGEAVTVTATAPMLSSYASAAVSIGGSVRDTATLTGAFQPGGTMAFALYGPADPTCAGSPAFTTTSTVASTDTSSAPFVPVSPGAYLWVASYGGDAANAAIAGHCGDGGEAVAVSKAAPALTTQASAGATIGGSVNDTATLHAGFAPAGTITFDLYGPDDPSCSGEVAFTTSVAVAAAGASSGSFRPGSAGTYLWVASYAGDANNAPASGRCGDVNETVKITKASPTLSTTASGTVGVGGTLLDRATLIGGLDPTGVLSFSLYGPNDPSCSGQPVYTDSEPVALGNGNHSAPYAATQLGISLWVVSYGGDGANNGVSGHCGDANESATVTAISAGGGAGGSASTSTSASSTSGTASTGSTGSSGALTPPAGGGGSGPATKGRAGSLTVGTGSGQVVVSWPKSGIAPGIVTVTVTPSSTATSTGGFAAGTSAIVLAVANGDGRAVTAFSTPLDLEFPNVAATSIPAYSSDGKTWIAIPGLTAPPTLPAGWPDGWYRDDVGTLHILTRHSTYFAVLRRGSKVTTALTFTASIAPVANLAKTPRLTVRVKPTLASRLAATLTRRVGGRALVAWKARAVRVGKHSLVFVLPKKRLAVGQYTLELSARAGPQHISQTLRMTVKKVRAQPGARLVPSA